MSHFLITGAKGGSHQGAAAPNRLEINDFVKVEDQFSLYVQALQSIYSHKSQSEIDSFFQIGGIHGLPYVSWDGSGEEPVDPDAWEGYCTHGNVLFPTFHRPYVALIEQVIQTEAIKIASKYTVDSARFQNAALNLRQPYWDWARNSVPPPEVISLDQVTITIADGSKVKVGNPLRRYTFHPIDPSFPSPYDGWKTTLRHPRSNAPDTKENINELKSTLKSVQTQLTTSTFNLLTRVHTWPAFSNHTPGDGGSSSNSLEAIHDGVHVDVGGNGQMSDPSVAGFDPIFFMHHAQVDRLLSLWSALNPGVWVSSGPAEGGTWTIPADATVDKNTNLTPFWNTQSSYWISSSVTDTAKMGYTYPEFNNLDMGNPNAVRAAIAQAVNKLYGGAAFNNIPTNFLLSSNLASELAKPTGTQVTASGSGTGTTTTARSLPTDAAPSNGAAATQENNGGVQFEVDSQQVQGIWDWTARVRVKKYEVGGSFSVLFFLGEVPSDPQDWRTSPNFVGAHNAFVNSSANRCANCRRQRDIELEGFVHLNDGIVRLSGLPSLEPNVVEPYLTRDLHWRVIKVSGDVVDIHQHVPSLEITVIATKLTLPPGGMFPEPSETHHHHGITHGRPGGSRQAPVA